MLVAGRAMQGLGGGGVVVLVHVCVADIFAIRYTWSFGSPSRLYCRRSCAGLSSNEEMQLLQLFKWVAAEVF